MLTLSRLVEGSLLTGSAATYFTAQAKAKALIKKATLTNVTSTDRTATVYLVPSGGSAGDANTILKAVAVLAGQCRDCPELVNHILEDGDTIQALASAATAVTLMVSGLEWKL